MIFQMINERLTAVQTGWKDAADALRRLAASIPGTDARVGQLGQPDPTLPEQGLQAKCFLNSFPFGQFQRIDKFIGNQDPAAPLITGAGDGTLDKAVKELEGNLTVASVDVFGVFASIVEAPPPLTSTEVLSCTDRLQELEDLIKRALADLNELREEVSQRFYLSGIRNSVDNLSGFPLLTSEVGSGGQVAPAADTGSGRSTLTRTIDSALRTVLGRQPRLTDTRTFLASLEQSFVSVALEGRTEYRWMQRGFVGQTDLGGAVSGAQASLFSRARALETDVQKLLDTLYPLREDADDELTEAARSIVRSEFRELVGELGTEGGPRRARVDGLFDLLFNAPMEVNVDNRRQTANGHLEVLQLEFGLKSQFVNTLEEEFNLTNYTALRDHIESIRTGWISFRDTLFGKDLGTRLVLLSRALSVATESVQEVNDAMDSVFVGIAERQVAFFLDEDGHRVFVGELLSWIASFTRDEATGLVHSGGRRGVEAIIPTTIKLRDLVERLIKSLPFEEFNLPDGMRHPRVTKPLRELRGHLDLVRRHAEEVKRP